LSRAEEVGKRGTHVPSLFTATFKRKVGVVPDSNSYVFVQPRSDGHLKSADVMIKHSSECGTECPQALQSTQLRKHVDTISQVLNLKENELDPLAQFTGHNIRVHREYYRMPSDKVHKVHQTFT